LENELLHLKLDKTDIILDIPLFNVAYSTCLKSLINLIT